MTFSSTKKFSGYILTATASLTLIACGGGGGGGGSSSNDATEIPPVVTAYNGNVALHNSSYSGMFHSVQLNQKISGSLFGWDPSFHDYEFVSPNSELLIFKVDGAKGADFDIKITNETTSNESFGDTYADDETLIVSASSNDEFSIVVTHHSGEIEEDYKLTVSQLDREVLGLKAGEYLATLKSTEAGTCNPSDGSPYPINIAHEYYVILDLKKGGFKEFYQNVRPGYSISFDSSGYTISDSGFTGTTSVTETSDDDNITEFRVKYSLEATFANNMKSASFESNNTYRIEETDDTITECISDQTGTFTFLL